VAHSTLEYRTVQQMLALAVVCSEGVQYYTNPTALGGKDDLSNKWVYHRHCHDEKTAEDLARIAKLKVTGNGHAQFWIGGGGSNPVADYTHP
jgi:hypothetical protein